MDGREISRRRFLARTGITLGGAAAWSAGLVPASTVDAALAAVTRRAASIRGTTLEATITVPPTPGYVRLGTGPGWPTLRRADLAPGARDDAAPRPRRVRDPVALAAMVHLTDIHVIDAQSPGRVELLDPFGSPFDAAFRPQETLSVHVASSMVRRVNELDRGPITGRRLDCAVSTGDNIDNQQRNELDWFVRVLDGGPLRANSGATDAYEGVQQLDGERRYWQPESPGPDRYQALGFPTVPGFLAAAIAQLDAPGLRIPWYATYGNHDGLIQGNVPATDAIDTILAGGDKILDLGTVPFGAFLAEILADQPAVLRRLRAGELRTVSVTPDERRRSASTRDWVERLLRSPARPGPRGHGYRAEHLDAPHLAYEFRIAPGVRGISLDTGGYNSGSIGARQLQWLEAVLRRVHSVSYGADGRPVRSGRTDELVVVFSHFTRQTMTSKMVDPQSPDERRILGDELTAVLHRYPNVIAWVNGHTHVNSVQPVPDPAGRGGFWEINTASHVDYPEHARVIELVDNRDGTLSLWCTMLEHVAPAQVPYDHLDPIALASLSRELAANDRQVDPNVRLGRLEDLNVECVITAPFGARGR